VFLSCKKQQPTIQPEPTPQVITSTPTPTVEVKTPKLFNLQGTYTEMYCLLNSKGIKPPFNVYKSDTVYIFAKVQSTYPQVNNSLEIRVYLDSKLIDEKQGIHQYEKTLIIE
jgi:hypothetical protein